MEASHASQLGAQALRFFNFGSKYGGQAACPLILANDDPTLNPATANRNGAGNQPSEANTTSKRPSNPPKAGCGRGAVAGMASPNR